MRVVAELLRPFMPDTGERMLGMLGVDAGADVVGDACGAARWRRARTLGETSALFPRIEHTVEELQTDGSRYQRRRRGAPAPASAAAPAPRHPRRPRQPLPQHRPSRRGSRSTTS